MLKISNQTDTWIPIIKLRNEFDTKSYHLKSLIDKGILDHKYQEVNRVLIKTFPKQSKEIILSQSQKKALAEIKKN